MLGTGRIYRLKGKRVSEAQYNAHQKRCKHLTYNKETQSPPADAKCSDNGALLSDENSAPTQALQTDEIEEEIIESTAKVQGRRIVEIAELGKKLWCVYCKECLSLEHIERETISGSGSIFTIRCHKCLVLSTVPTGKQLPDSMGRLSRFAVNTKLALGEFVYINHGHYNLSF